MGQGSRAVESTTLACEQELLSTVVKTIRDTFMSTMAKILEETVILELCSGY